VNIRTFRCVHNIGYSSPAAALLPVLRSETGAVSGDAAGGGIAYMHTFL